MSINPLGGGRLRGKVVLVTGAGRGIGEAIARRFAAEGARVVINARTESRLLEVTQAIASEGGTVRHVAADIGTADGVSQLVTQALGQFQQLDILVHNAAIFPYQPLETMDDASWQNVIDVNLTSAFRLLKACLPALKHSTSGRILFTSSVQGNRTAVPGCAHYAASKAGLNGFIRAAAFELAPHRITVNGVEPGLVLTEGVETALSERRRQLMADYVPLKRWGEPVEVAHAMVFLASEEAGYITGQTLVVDGGALLPQNGSFMVRS
jgi:3-oxoacyl-[acyl-carrier protein] reductase